ncbi:MAG: hypothetical protein R6U41_10555, partial [Desulfosalsimonas sp.]|uniref:hypothetical protein n=1 Tax=Desulfosalsimonas sp. TaxID=3073848 RepID=UPI0039709E39
TRPRAGIMRKLYNQARTATFLKLEEERLDFQTAAGNFSVKRFSDSAEPIRKTLYGKIPGSRLKIQPFFF